MNNDLKALYNFFYSMGDMAVDIFWGNGPNIDDEDREKIAIEDQDRAFELACAEMAYDEEFSEWHERLPALLAEYYGRHLRAAFARRTIEEVGRDEKSNL